MIDYQWNYLFANRPANEKLNGFQVVGKNIRSVWEENSQFNFQPVYSILKENVEKQIPLFLKTKSPISGKSIEILGHPLKDCYLFLIGEQLQNDQMLKEYGLLLN